MILKTLLPSEEMSWIMQGLKLAGRPGPLVYKTDVCGDDETAAATEVIHWLDRAGNGEEKRGTLWLALMFQGTGRPGRWWCLTGAFWQRTLDSGLCQDWWS